MSFFKTYFFAFYLQHFCILRATLQPATVALMDEYLKQNGYANDMNSQRLHHEIYLSDARKVAPEKWKTVIRHPIRKI